MPTPEEILNGLAIAANRFTSISILWHLIIAAFTLVMLTGRKFNTKIIGSGLGILLLSVAIIAYLVSNPFNAVMFAAAALLFGIYNLQFKPVPVSLEWNIFSVSGLIMVLFGFVYPHFLDNGAFYRYLYASPLGLIPCPTLSAFIGITLMLRGFRSKKWMITATLPGLFYGFVGVLWLRVYMDAVLIAGSLLLLVLAFSPKVLKGD